jgi:hypothetical protein
MKILFNYADLKFYNSQKLNTETGLSIGGFDKVFDFKKEDITQEFYLKNKNILDQPRGAGYWLWKFHFAVRLLNDESIPEDSYIFYADSGSKFIGSIDELINVFERDNLSVMTFRQNHLSYVWTKRDAFILTDTDSPEYTHTGARVGGWFLLKKNDFSREFMNKCLEYGCDHRIISDSPSELGVPNYDGFIENRHDETVITLVSKKYGLFPYRNPSQWGFIGDVNFTDNMYGEEATKIMVGKFGELSTWGNKYGNYFHGESLNQYPHFTFDDKSTYPTIMDLHKSPQ